MLTKRGINSTKLEKRVRGVAPDKIETPDREASTGSAGVTKTFRCGSCGGSFQKQCSEGYLCDVMNTQCPKCGGDLR